MCSPLSALIHFGFAFLHTSKEIRPFGDNRMACRSSFCSFYLIAPNIGESNLEISALTFTCFSSAFAFTWSLRLPPLIFLI